MKIFRLLFAICVLLFASSCGVDIGVKIAVMHNYAFNKLNKIDGPYEIKEAIRDGCQSALWSRGNHFYRSLATFRQNVDLMTNEVYKFAWYKAYNLCFQMNTGETFLVFGAKSVSNSMSGFADPRDAKDWVGLPVGGNPDYAPNIMFNEDTSKGMFGFSDANKLGNMYGMWGTCQFC